MTLDYFLSMSSVKRGYAPDQSLLPTDSETASSFALLQANWGR